MSGPAKFTRALVRPPGDTFSAGLTTAGLGAPDVALARAQHEAYVRALADCGLAVTRLPADEAHPDSTFVEDAALVTARGALLTRPGAESRRGEVAAVGRALAEFFPAVETETVRAPGTLDAGDVCEAGGHFFIGVSERTNDEGARQLATWLARRGFTSATVDIRGLPGLLHLKSGLAHLGGRRLFAVAALARHPALRGWDVLCMPPGEDYAANCVLVNDAVLAPAGFPLMATALLALGLRVVELDVSEFRKMDGGLSCLSLRW
jgi:dimethylargininase